MMYPARVLAQPPSLEGFNDIVFFFVGMLQIATLIAIVIAVPLAVLQLLGLDVLGLVRSMFGGKRVGRIVLFPRKMLFILVMFFLLMMFLFAATPTRAADGAAGSVAVSSDSLVSGGVIVIRAFDLTVSSDYLLNWTGNDAGVAFTTGSSQTDFQLEETITSTASVITVYLRAQSAGTIIDQVTVNMNQLTDFLSTTLIIGAGIFVLIIAVFSRVAKRSND